MQRKEEKKTNLFSLEGKNAVVTGCATGIGQGLAVGLAKAGAKILAFDIADLSETKQKVEEVGGECQLYRVDLSNSAMIDEVWHLAVEENQHIDILFNNAGMQHRESVLTYPEDVFDRVIAVNLKSAFLMAQKAANHFKERGCRGKIINTASLFSTFGGEIGMGILRGDAMKNVGLYGLTYYDAGSRCFFSSKPIHSPADMKGMLVRVQESELMMSMVEKLGASSIAIAYSECYSSLQTGVCDAAENSIVNYLDMSFYEVAPYYIKDDHTRSADILVMSQKTREKLSEEDLAIIDQTALDSWEYQKELWANAEKENEQKLLDTGKVEIYTPTDEEAAEFRDACTPIWYSYEGGKYTDLVDQIQAAAE